MKGNLPQLIKEVRHDLSDWPWHFTRWDRQPFEALKQIIASKHILGSQDKFCAEKAVCLIEMPLTEAYRQSQLLDEHSYNRFSDYGIGFKKSLIAAKGGLPVIYQPNRCSSSLIHRCVGDTASWTFRRALTSLGNVNGVSQVTSCSFPTRTKS